MPPSMRGAEGLATLKSDHRAAGPAAGVGERRAALSPGRRALPAERLLRQRAAARSATCTARWRGASKRALRRRRGRTPIAGWSPSTRAAALGEKALFDIARDRPRAAAIASAITDAGRAYLDGVPRRRPRARGGAMRPRRGGRVQEAALPTPPPPGLAQVFNLRFWSGDASTRVVLDVEKQVQFQHDRISDPDRLWVDLDGTRLHPNLVGRSLPGGRRAAREDPHRAEPGLRRPRRPRLQGREGPHDLLPGEPDAPGGGRARHAAAAHRRGGATGSRSPHGRPPDPIEPRDRPPATEVAADGADAVPITVPARRPAHAGAVRITFRRRAPSPPRSTRRDGSWTRHDGTLVASATPPPSAPWPGRHRARRRLRRRSSRRRSPRNARHKTKREKREEREAREAAARAEAARAEASRTEPSRTETARLATSRVDRELRARTAAQPPAVNRAGLVQPGPPARAGRAQDRHRRRARRARSRQQRQGGCRRRTSSSTSRCGSRSSSARSSARR